MSWRALVLVWILGLPAVIGVMAYIYTGHSPFSFLQVMVSGMLAMVALWWENL